MGQRGLTGEATRYIARQLSARKQAGDLTLDEISSRTGVPRSTVDRALRGEGTLAVETLVQLCAGLGIDAAELVHDAALAAGGTTASA